MKTIIAGSRSASRENVASALEACKWTERITVVLSGLANGADRHGEVWAKRTGKPLEKYPADWETFGKRAGFIRNRKMAERANALIAVWDGKSNGTRNMIQEAAQRKLRIFVFRF